MIMRFVLVLHQLLQPAAQLFLAALLLLHRELRAAASHACLIQHLNFDIITAEQGLLQGLCLTLVRGRHYRGYSTTTSQLLATASFLIIPAPNHVANDYPVSIACLTDAVMTRFATGFDVLEKTASKQRHPTPVCSSTVHQPIKIIATAALNTRRA
jgi:hypothetical protein